MLSIFAKTYNLHNSMKTKLLLRYI